MPALIGAVTVVGQRTGPRVAGVLTALPVVAGPIALFVAIEQGAAFEARSAVATLAALLAVAAFCILYARTCLRRGWPASLLAGLFGFGLTTLALKRLDPGLAGATALALASPLCVQMLTPRPPPPARVRPVSRAGLFGRMGAGAALMIGVTALADALGPTWSGLLTVFPVATTVLTVSWHRTQGPEFRRLSAAQPRQRPLRARGLLRRARPRPRAPRHRDGVRARARGSRVDPARAAVARYSGGGSSSQPSSVRKPARRGSSCESGGSQGPSASRVQMTPSALPGGAKA